MQSAGSFLCLSDLAPRMLLSHLLMFSIRAIISNSYFSSNKSGHQLNRKDKFIWLKKQTNNLSFN